MNKAKEGTVITDGEDGCEDKVEKGNNVVYNLVDLMKGGSDLSSYYTKGEADEKISSTGHLSELSISSDYVMNVELKDKNG